MSTAKWSARSAEHEVRYTGDDSFLVVPMSKTSVGAEGIYGLWFGCPVQRLERSSRRPSHVGVSASSTKPRVKIDVFGVEIAGDQDQRSPAKIGG